MGRDEHRGRPLDAQWERANQSWSLVVEVTIGELSADASRRLHRILRVKRSEREAFANRLPGVVRKGARIDLEPLRAELAGADIACSLVATPKAEGSEDT